jgi:hypothetical protein
MQAEIPNSERFRYPRIFCNVPVSPINSAPRLSRNIFREKKVRKSDRK